MLTVNNSGRRIKTSTILLLPHLFLRHNNRMMIRTLRILLFKVMNCTQCRFYKRSESDFKIETDRALSAGRIDYRRPLEFFPPYLCMVVLSWTQNDRSNSIICSRCMHVTLSVRPCYSSASVCYCHGTRAGSEQAQLNHEVRCKIASYRHRICVVFRFSAVTKEHCETVHGVNAAPAFSIITTCSFRSTQVIKTFCCWFSVLRSTFWI